MLISAMVQENVFSEEIIYIKKVSLQKHGSAKLLFMICAIAMSSDHYITDPIADWL